MLLFKKNIPICGPGPLTHPPWDFCLGPCLVAHDGRELRVALEVLLCKGVLPHGFVVFAANGWVKTWKNKGKCKACHGIYRS